MFYQPTLESGVECQRKIFNSASISHHSLLSYLRAIITYIVQPKYEWHPKNFFGSDLPRHCTLCGRQPMLSLGRQSEKLLDYLETEYWCTDVNAYRNGFFRTLSEQLALEKLKMREGSLIQKHFLSPSFIQRLVTLKSPQVVTSLSKVKYAFRISTYISLSLAHQPRYGPPSHKIKIFYWSANQYFSLAFDPRFEGRLIKHDTYDEATEEK